MWVRTHRNVVEGKNPATWGKMAVERFETKMESLRGKCCADVLEFCLAQMGEDPEGKDPEGKDPEGKNPKGCRGLRGKFGAKMAGNVLAAFGWRFEWRILKKKIF